jgi:hypothetical protein
LAIISSLILPAFASKNISGLRKIIYGLYVVLSVWIITISNVRQAQIMCLVGITIYGYAILKRSSHVSGIVIKATAFVSFVVLLLVLIGAINQGPLASLIYKQTMGFRIEYWKTSLSMFFAHPLSGIGLDGYSDNFERYRPKNTYQVLGNVDYANASHNIFLDYLSGGGTVLALGYLLLVAMTFKAVLRVFRNSRIDDPILGVALAWVLYQVQSFVSIGQIGLSVLGWILSGLLLGFNKANIEIGQSKLALKSDPKFFVFSFIGALLSFGVSMPPTVVDAQWKNAVVSQDGERIFKLAKTWPYETTRLIKASEAFSQAGYDYKSLSLIRFAVNFNQESLRAWQMLGDHPESTLDEKRLAQLQVKRLASPINPP